MKTVRVSIKAIILREGRILLIQCRDTQGDWYCLPGGGQRHGETVIDALQRECLEEIGLPIRAGRLRFVRDYIGSHHEFAEEDGDAHQVELMFACDLTSPEGERRTNVADPMQVGSVWIALAQLHRYRLYPQALTPLLQHEAADEGPVYLGDVN